MACQDIFRNIYSKRKFILACIILKLAIDWNESRIVTSDNLILYKSLLEWMTLFIC